jgi:hypothetical protein
MEEAKVKYVCPCGEGHAYPSLCPQDLPEDDYRQRKLEETGYPGYPFTSQQDEILAKAKEPGMYEITNVKTMLEIDGEPAIWVDKLSPNKVSYEFQNIPEHSMQIVLEILPKALELYLKKTKDYGGLSGGLGPRAPFVDMWRKILKLKRCMWDGDELKFEQTDEIIMDLIGTCLNILGEMSNDET